MSSAATQVRSSPADPPQPPRGKRRRFLIGGIVVCVLLIAAGLWGIPRFLKWQARRDLNLRHLDQASQSLDRLERWYGVDGESSFLRARLARKRGDWPSVRAALLRAQELRFPVSVLEREQWLTQAQSGQIRAAEPYLPKLLVDPQGDANEICEAFVNGYFLNYRMTDALQLLEAWIADYPKDREPLIIRAKIRVEQQYLKEAETDLRKAVLLDPSPTAMLELADVLVLERQLAEALQIYQKTAREHQGTLRASQGEAKVQRLLGQPEASRAAAQRILDVDSDNREALLERALADLDLNQDVEAIPALQSLLRLNPRSLMIRQGLARALRSTGDVKAAREHAEYVETAQAALHEAEKLATRVTQHPEDTEARYQIGMTYLQFAVPERGVQWLKSVLNYDPNHAGAKQALSEYYATDGATSDSRSGAQTDRPNKNADTTKTESSR